jgi:GNAT superfamily N-acetyltransferase
MHYRAGTPRVIDCVWAACARTHVVGVLCIARPCLNAGWRDLAWPGVFACGARERATRVNALVRTIARVMVEPRYRGLGVAKALVRAYLREPLTPLTEALASMGWSTPFFARAGMREVSLARSRRDARLERVLLEHDVDIRLLGDVHACEQWARHPRVARAVRAWARSSRATRSHTQDIPALLLRGASRIIAPPRIFVAGEAPRGKDGA